MMTAQSVLPIRNRLAERRGDRSLRQMARALGLSAGGLHQLEAGEIFPKRETLERMCRVFGCDVGDLYTVEARGD